MGRGNNIPKTGQDFFYTRAGDNTVSGRSNETPVFDPQTAIGRANDLDPPPSSLFPASINASVSGTYFQSVTIPDFVNCTSALASLIAVEPFCVSCGNRQGVSWGALINFNDGGSCLEIDGKFRVSAEVNTMVVGTEGDIINQRDSRIEPTQAASINNVGFLVTESCSEIFCSVVSAVIGGEGASLIRHDATSPNPVEYIVGNCTFFGDNQTFMEFNPPNATDQAIVNASSIQESTDAASTANSMGYRVRSGRLIADNEVIQAKYIGVIEEEGQFAIDSIIAVGKISVKDNAFANIAAEILVSDIEVDATAQANFMALNYSGTVTPSDPGAGPINGHLGSRRFGTWRVLDVVVLKGVDGTIQTPANIGVPLQVTFGPAQANPEVSVDALGNITILVTNEYFFEFNFQLGRTFAGGVADMHLRTLVGGVQVGEDGYWALDKAGDDVRATILTDPLDLVAGQVVTVELLRSISGANDGSLFPVDPLQATWAVAPSASVTAVRRT